MDLGSTLVEVLGGLSVAATLFLVAAGLTLIFGALRIMNIAHGSFYMYGAYLSAALMDKALASGLGFVVAILVAPLLVAALAALLEVLVMRRIYAREHLTQLLATYAVFLILADLALRLWGADLRSVDPPRFLAGHLSILGHGFPDYSVFVTLVALGVGLGLWLLLGRTRLGWQVRAAMDDPELLAVQGVNVRLIVTVMFTLASGLAGFAGAVVAPQISLSPGLDANVLVEAFIVAVIGGLGSVVGAAIGAVLIGLLEALGVVFLPSWSSAVIYLAMIAVLLIRPWGLLGSREG